MPSSFGRTRPARQLLGASGSRAGLHYGGPAVSTTAVPDRFTTLHGEDALQATVTALEVHAFSVKVVHDLDAAREAVPTRIEEGSSVMTNTPVILQETGIRRGSATADTTTRRVPGCPRSTSRPRRSR